MNETITLLVLAAALGAAVLFHRSEAAAWRAERADLLNRLMSQNWGQYLAGIQSAAAPEIETPQVLTDDDEARWYAKVSGNTARPETAEAAWHRQNFAEHPELYPDGLPEAVAA